MTKQYLTLVMPAIENGQVDNRRYPPPRRRNIETRPREYLTPAEVEQLIEAAKGGRWGHRDSTMLFTAFRHGLRASELIGLQWFAGRLRRRDPARPQDEEREVRHSPIERRRTPRLASVAARAVAAISFRVHDRAGIAVCRGRVL
jgi:integrase